MTYEDMEQITKEWLEEFLVPIDDAELFNTNLIGILLVNRVEYARKYSVKKKMKKVEVQNIETDEEYNASEENGSGSPIGGGGEEDQVDGNGKRDEG
jgi:hypothetical protein